MPRRLHNCAPIAALLAVLAFASPALSAEDAPKVPAPPLFEGPKASYTLPGAITSSDDKTTTGLIYTTLGKPMTIYDRAKKRYVEFPLADVARIDVAVEEEHEEPYWYWKESGSDEKVFTGNTYPWRKYLTTVTFASGKKITGDMAGPLYIETPSGEKKQFILHKRDKGKEGQKLSRPPLCKIRRPFSRFPARRQRGLPCSLQNTLSPDEEKRGLARNFRAF